MIIYTITFYDYKFHSQTTQAKKNTNLIHLVNRVLIQCDEASIRKLHLKYHGLSCDDFIWTHGFSQQEGNAELFKLTMPGLPFPPCILSCRTMLASTFHVNFLDFVSSVIFPHWQYCIWKYANLHIIIL